MDADTYKLINMLERAPRSNMTFSDNGVKTVVAPCYILLEDVERIVRLLVADVEWKHRALLAEAHLRDAVAANEKAIVAARAEGISIGKRT